MPNFQKDKHSLPLWWRTCTYKTLVSRFPLLPYYRRLSLDFPSEWPPNPNPKNKKIRNLSTFLISRCSMPYLRGTCFPFLHFSVIIIWKDLRELLFILVGHLCSSTKKSKRFNLMLKSLLSNNISNRFKFIMIPTRGTNMWRPSYKWTDDSYRRKNYGMYTTWCQVSLKGG